MSGRGKVKRPITFGCIVMIIITTISGTATTPLITALQNSALIGSILMKLITIPMTVPPTQLSRRPLGVLRATVEADRPDVASRLEGIGGGAGEDWHGQQTGAENPQGKNREGEIAGDRAQGLRRLLGGLDVGDPVCIQRRRGGDDNEQC